MKSGAFFLKENFVFWWGLRPRPWAGTASTEFIESAPSNFARLLCQESKKEENEINVYNVFIGVQKYKKYIWFLLKIS